MKMTARNEYWLIYKILGLYENWLQRENPHLDGEHFNLAVENRYEFDKFMNIIRKGAK